MPITAEMQEEALIRYINNGYASINQRLRKEERSSDPFWDNAAMALESKIDSSRVGAKTLYRGISVTANIDKNMFQVGAEINDKGFMSTTTNKKVADRFSKSVGVVLRIKSTPSTKGLDVNKTLGKQSYHAVEQEVLLQHNTTLRITKVDAVGGRLFVDAEIVAQGRK